MLSRTRMFQRRSYFVLMGVNILLLCMSTTVLAISLVSTLMQIVKIMVAPEAWAVTAAQRQASALAVFKVVEYVKNMLFSVEVRSRTSTHSCVVLMSLCSFSLGMRLSFGERGYCGQTALLGVFLS